MRNLLKITLFLSVFSLFSGCASLTAGPQQNMKLTATGDAHPSETVCTAENDKGITSLTPGKVGKVFRSGKPLHIECLNSSQFGAMDIPARRRNVTKFFNFFFIDFCTISCAIDRKTGRGYAYPGTPALYLVETGRGEK